MQFLVPSYWKRTVVDAALLVLFVAAVYFPVVTHRYGYMDDFWMFFHTGDMPTPYFPAGRVLTGIVWMQVHERIESVEQLGVLRLFAVVAACGIACQLYALARHLSANRFVRIGLGTSVAALPSITVLVAWATCWMYTFAPVFGMLSSSVAASAIRVWPRDRRRFVVLTLVSSGLLLVSAGSYQPGVSWFWIIPLVLVLNRRFMTNPRHRVRVMALVAVGLFQLGFCFLALKLYFATTGVVAQDRSSLISDPLAKFYSLFRTQIPLALNQWQVLDVSRKPLMIATALGVASVLMLGALVFVRRFRSARTRQGKPVASVHFWLSTLLVIVALSHTHWWVIEYTAKNYRTAGAFSACVTVALWWSVVQIVRALSTGPWHTRLLICVSILLTAVALVKCSRNLGGYWVHPYSTAYSFTLDEFAAKVSMSTEHIHIIRQSPEEGIVTRRNIYNFGRPFTDFDWAIDGFVQAAMNDTDVDANIRIITHGLGEDPVPNGPGVAIIDMRQLMQYRQEKID